MSLWILEDASGPEIVKKSLSDDEPSS